jgi:hypothetical protein
MPDLQDLLLEFEDGLRAGKHPLTLLQRHLSISQQHFSSPVPSLNCTNLHSITFSPRGDGSEALALITPLALACPDNLPNCWGKQDVYGGAAALAIGLALSRYLGQVQWLARDFVWVVPDGRCGLEGSVAAWMAAHQGTQAKVEEFGQFQRAGALQQVLCCMCSCLLLQCGRASSLDAVLCYMHNSMCLCPDT